MSSSSESSAEGPWEGCGGQDAGFLEKDDTGCLNPDDGYYAKASKNDVFGGVKYTGYWQSCKNLCSAAAQGSMIDSNDLECGRGHYMTYNKDTGSCYFYRPPSAESNGCSHWRSKDSDRLGMYCGPEGSSGSSDSSSDSEQDKPPPSPSPSPPPTGDSSDTEEDSSDSSAEEGVDYSEPPLLDSLVIPHLSISTCLINPPWTSVISAICYCGLHSLGHVQYSPPPQSAAVLLSTHLPRPLCLRRPKVYWLGG